MCGIGGQIDPAGPRPQTIQAILHPIRHRGPDDEGVVVAGCAGLGSRRLSIIDLVGGHQPLANEDETVWLVVNGEIYNYRALRHALQQRGHLFRTASDSEVILHLYEEMGDRCMEPLNGMFAFALWDTRQQKLLLVRDRLGQKPLFYSQDGERFTFASEMKGVLAVDTRPRTLNPIALDYYLSLRFLPPPHTMLPHIHKLPPAHRLIWQEGEIRLERYWQLSFREKLALSEDAFLTGLEENLTQAVTSHQVSDVPVGAFLSGGLDSSMVVALMARSDNTPLKTFAIGVENQSFNELPYARQVAEAIGTEHYENCVQADLITLLPQMIWHLDEPSDPIAACQYYAAALAARHVKVVLGGDGGDELFAGFDRYSGQRYVNLYARLPHFLRQQVVGGILSRLPENFAYKSLSQKARWLNQLSLAPDAAARYAEATAFFRFNRQDKAALYTPAFRRMVRDQDAAHILIEAYTQAPADDPLDRMLYTDIVTRLPEHSLMLTDRMTMAHSLEARSPFLDHELVAYLAAFPAQMKVRGRVLKYSLRQLAQKYLPPAIVQRPKQGFMFPIAYWFRGELYPMLERTLLNSPLVQEGLFEAGYIRRLLEEHRNSQVDHHVRLWMLLNLTIWQEMYMSSEFRVPSFKLA
ncbi:MAG: asparagine synthase (glutamine-hydrolyzing) [Anaerolineae bacterium]|nr:asparagine synthase (glutamine-hydrolyzing) [Anaerolineae bacterium]